MKKNRKKKIWGILLILIIILVSTVYLKIVIYEKDKIEIIFNNINIHELESIYDLISENNNKELKYKLNNTIIQLENLESTIKNEFNKIIYLRILLFVFIIIFILFILIYFNKYNRIKKYRKKIYKKIKEKNKLKLEIEKAIQNKEFKLYIQPRYETITEQVTGGEILVRWVKENGDIIYPDQFIKELEENNLIKMLDIYILENTCKKIEEWKYKNYKELKISINQSQTNLLNEKYINEIKEIINKYKFNYNLLEIELTENIFIENKNKVKKLEEELHKINIKIAIDDFGSGYSSYNLLNEIKIDILKLDKKLFYNLENEKTKIIINAIIKMTKELNIDSIAEGIETKEQVAFLKEINCNEIQGYYFSKPKPIEEFEKEIFKQ